MESRETLLELAKMTNNAYVEPSDPAWYDLGTGWNSVCAVLFSWILDMADGVFFSSLTLLDGSRMQMGSGDRFLRLRIIVLLSFLSRGRRRGCLVEGDRRLARTS